MLTKSKKKYLFAIYMLGENGGSVKSTLVSDLLGVSKASTVKMTQRLIEDGYIIKEPYREIRLTELGRQEADRLFRPSVVLQDFLENRVGVEKSKAREDSIIMAAELSAESLEKLVTFAEKDFS